MFPMLGDALLLGLGGWGYTVNRLFALGCVLAALLAVPAFAQAPSFLAFETGQVRPLALTPNGKTLLALNTPDNALEIFAVRPGGLIHQASVPVGLEPCAVAVVGHTEAWVVNHLSDSVSVVDLEVRRVTRTLLVGDEPRDIVIADHDGPGGDAPRAFITTAHRGQHRTHGSILTVPGAGDPQLTTASVGRADVWVFDTGALGATLGGTPLEIVELFGDTPRALAVSPDGSSVYAAVFHSGNQTAVVSEGKVCDNFVVSNCDDEGDDYTSPNGLPGGDAPGGNPGPATNFQFITAPEVGLVVKFDDASGEWRDEGGRNWSNGIRFYLPDLDVFEIDADTLNETDSFPHVGTILFNMVVNPANGKVYVSNTDAQNLKRFEGPGGFGPTTVQGDLARSRITVLDGAFVNPRHLNKHINYGVLPAPAGTKDHSLATPLDMVVSSDGTTLYVAAFGSSKVGVFDTAALENDTFDPTVASANYIALSGGGPSGLALDETNGHLFVLTRFDNSLSVVDLVTGTEINHIPLHNPEPASVVEGRPFLYDAAITSSNGEASCSSCHIFGDFDSLAWDLGDPDGSVTSNPIPINLCIPLVGGCPSDQNGGAADDEFHPMKGPMTTQTLRGLRNAGAMHWRGDRSNGFFGQGAFDEDLSFRNFIVAFEGLVGRDSLISGTDMQKFTDFQLQVVLPPNPVRALDNSLDTAQQSGRDFYFGDHGGNDCSDGLCILGLEGLAGFSCEGCHTLNPSQGFFGTDGTASFENEKQIFKIAHLRNLYQKVGMFGMPNVPFNNSCTAGSPCDGIDNTHQGDQVRGTGFLHDGSTDTIFRFFQADVFNNNPGANAGFDGGNTQRRNVEQFMLAFDSDLAPIVGQQITLDATNAAAVGPRIDLLIQRAGAAFSSQVLGGSSFECDLVVKGFADGRAWLYNRSTGLFDPDVTGEASLTDAGLRALAGGATQELTYTCATPGSGIRMALDRDEDGVLNRDESAAGTDPANPGSEPGACGDGSDNDGDGLVDAADPGCGGTTAGDIENPQCSDGYDNDADGLTDASDPQCLDGALVYDPSDDVEVSPGCGNAILEAGEQCDDGNTDDGDCCSATCQFQPALGVGGSPNCCSMGVCQTGAACGAICMTPGAICKQDGGPGTACTCEIP